METFHERLDRLEYYIQLLFEITDLKSFPFYGLIIQKKLTQKDVDELLCLCHQLTSLYEKQKEEGLIDFSSLLVHFVGMLNPKLIPKETIEALIAQHLFEPLMLQLLNEIQDVPK